MARQTIFCVQPYEKKGRGFRMAQLRQFKSPDDALQAGERAVPRSAGVLVYSIEGDAEFEDWSQPVVLARHGELPEIEF